MSVVPLISALMPVPEPPPVTCSTVPGFFCMYASAQRWPRMTIVSEPLMVTVPACAGSAATPSDANPTSVAKRVLSFMFMISCVLVSDCESLAGRDSELRLKLQGEEVLRDRRRRRDARRAEGVVSVRPPHVLVDARELQVPRDEDEGADAQRAYRVVVGLGGRGGAARARHRAGGHVAVRIPDVPAGRDAQVVADV